MRILHYHLFLFLLPVDMDLLSCFEISKLLYKLFGLRIDLGSENTIFIIVFLLVLLWILIRFAFQMSIFLFFNYHHTYFAKLRCEFVFISKLLELIIFKFFLFLGYFVMILIKLLKSGFSFFVEFQILRSKLFVY